MAADVHFRFLVDSDRPAVVALLENTLRTTWWPEMTPEARASIDGASRIRGYVETMGHEFMLAVAGDRVVGMVHWRGDFIHALHVHSDAQRQGIGGSLLAHAEAAMSAAGNKATRLETDTFNTKSRSFYAAHGYVEKDRYPDTTWQSGFTTILFVKPLPAT